MGRCLYALYGVHRGVPENGGGVRPKKQGKAAVF